MKRSQKGAAAAIAASGLALSATSSAVMIPVSFANTTGIEFSDNIDRKANGSVQNGQSVVVEDDGTTADGIQYPGGLQVDAMSSKFDPFFNGIFTGQSALLLGTAGDTTFENGVKFSVMAVTPDGTVTGWAKPSDFFANGANDVDSIETSGVSGLPDAELFSVIGDFSDVSIWDFNGGSPVAWMTRTELDTALGLAGTGLSADLDALIVNGNKMIFSIKNLGLGNFDGGELFVYERGSGVAATILEFGGKTWNTAFDSGIFLGCRGHISETDILSAVGIVPEPGTMCGISAGALALLRRRKK